MRRSIRNKIASSHLKELYRLNGLVLDPNKPLNYKTINDLERSLEGGSHCGKDLSDDSDYHQPDESSESSSSESSSN
jgi:hypothetical protein